MSKKSKKNPTGTKITKEFEFALTPDESNALGKEMAKLDHGVAELEVQFEEVKSNWKAKIQAAEAKRRDISAVVHAQKQRRTVEAVMVKNYEAKEIQFYFEGVVVESRTMTPAESQVEADFTKNAKKARAVRQKLQKPDPVAEAHAKDANGVSQDVAQVVREETSRRTKSSSVDGPTTIN